MKDRLNEMEEKLNVLMIEILNSDSKNERVKKVINSLQNDIDVIKDAYMDDK